MSTYALVIGAVALATLALLRLTKNPAIVTVLAATIVSCGFMLWARLTDGYWAKFAVAEFTIVWFFAAFVSFAILGLGRSLKWRFFLKASGAPDSAP